MPEHSAEIEGWSIANRVNAGQKCSQALILETADAHNFVLSSSPTKVLGGVRRHLPFGIEASMEFLEIFRQRAQRPSTGRCRHMGHDGTGEHIGVQCKNTLAGITLKVVKDEIANAESFKPKLDHLYISTTAPRDASLQRDVRLISIARKAAGNF